MMCISIRHNLNSNLTKYSNSHENLGQHTYLLGKSTSSKGETICSNL